MLHFFFFNDTATTEIYTLSLHDALPISWIPRLEDRVRGDDLIIITADHGNDPTTPSTDHSRERSEEHTSELQSRLHLVCRLLLEKKKKKTDIIEAIVVVTVYSKCMSMEY